MNRGFSSWVQYAFDINICAVTFSVMQIILQGTIVEPAKDCHAVYISAPLALLYPLPFPIITRSTAIGEGIKLVGLDGGLGKQTVFC